MNEDVSNYRVELQPNVQYGITVQADDNGALYYIGQVFVKGQGKWNYFMYKEGCHTNFILVDYSKENDTFGGIERMLIRNLHQQLVIYFSNPNLCRISIVYGA